MPAIHGSAIAEWVDGSDTAAVDPAKENTMNDRPTALVLGANGRFGLAAAQAFAAAGWQVLAQVRRDAAAGMPLDARALRVPVDQVDALVAQAAGAQVVVHALNPAYTRWAAEALPLARAGMDVAERLGAAFMLPGNVYNFGSAMPPLLRPDTPQRADTRKGHIRVAIEDEMRARAARGLASVVVRAGDFYGGGPGSWFDRVIVKSLAGGRLAYPGPLDVAHAWAYLPDLARAFADVAARGVAPGFTNLHFAGHTLSGAGLLAEIAAAATRLGLPAPRRRGGIPWALLRLGAPLVPMWRELAEMEYLWRVPHALDGTALARALGAPPAETPLPQALERSLRELGFGERAAAPVPLQTT
jgi:nucleoside-diphosphate-sugar epimerase